ncbi:hypothetical protein [Okeania sp. SIO1I7]|uniref:hypothetical protein n=1 Tax=Okeania sp. SIO1I7 TaxID=2607772 RepID=UPI0013F6B574|nr:hypothetical protein [Okeania sp. SIO1I7]NET24912.1 hypothetical protein [Okeania sp. SIO1I7]
MAQNCHQGQDTIGSSILIKSDRQTLLFIVGNIIRTYTVPLHILYDLVIIVDVTTIISAVA